MTCSRNFRRIVQASCLGLIGALTVVGCGGSETTTKTDGGGAQGEVNPPGKMNINATPATVALGSVDVGTTSAPQTVTITNTGSAGTVTVTPTGVGISASGCGGTLAAGGNCIVSITATPTAVGPIVGSVAVVAAGGNAVSISVTGQAQLPGNFTVSPTAIALGDVAAGTPITTSVTVSSTVALTGLSVGVTGPDLKLDPSSTCGAALTANTPCKVTVVFNAAAAGTAIGDAIVVSQGGVTKTVPVSANVLSPAKLGATPATASLTTQPGSSSANLDINVGNTGGMVTGQIVVALAGTNAADFAIVSDKCSIVTLAAGAYCTVTVKYTAAATATVGGTATLTITDKGAGASSAAVALTGIVNASTLSITPATGALGSVAPGSTGTEVVFTVSNSATGTPTGALAAVVNSPLVTVSSNTCVTKATLAAGDSCTVGLKLAPSATTPAQSISGLLTVTGATAGKVSASFTGAVITGPTLTATPASVNFGSIPVNQSSTAQVVTIKNIGATATGTLTVNRAGTGTAQVAITANTCTGTLAPAATCTFSVQYSPTDQTGLNGTITVTDGAAAAAVTVVGTGLAPSFISVSALTFANTVVGYSNEQTATVTALTTAPTDSGAISTAFTGTNAAEFVVSGGTCATLATLQPNQTCTIIVTYTPTTAGAKAATLTVTSAKGGVYPLMLSAVAVPLVEIQAGGVTTSGISSWTTDTSATAFDFDTATLNKTGQIKAFRAIIRGATSPAATSTIATVTLATSTPPDFRNMSCNGETCVETTSNPCDGATLGLTAKTGVATGAASPWVAATVTGTDADPQVGHNVWTCVYYVQFYPQTSKGSKTATVRLAASAGGEIVSTLTGAATGPLQLSPTKYDFGNVTSGGASSANSGTTLTIGASEAGVAIFTVTNTGLGTQGPLSVALAGANAADFGIVVDGCTGQTLAASAVCYVRVAFAPTTLGAKTATLTASSAATSETTNTATLVGNAATTAQTLTLTPAATSAARYDFGSVVQAGQGEWRTFTVANPAGAPLSGKLTYGLSGTDAAQFEIYPPTGTTPAYPAGACGASNTKQLAAGETCTIQVRFIPNNTTAVGEKQATLTVTDAGGNSPLPVAIKGTSTSQLTLSAASIDFGKVATNTTKTQSVTLTNGGLSTITVTIPAGPFTIAAGTGLCTASQTLTTGQSCTLTYQYQGQADGTWIGTDADTPLVLTIGNGAQVSATLKANGQSVAPAHLSLYGFGDIANVDPVSFGNALVGASSGAFTVWFTNDGKVDAAGIAASVTAGSEFAIVSESTATSCGALANNTLAPAGLCSVKVQLSPTTSGGSASTKSATLTLAGAGGLASVLVPLTGLSHSASDTGVYVDLATSANTTVGTFGPTAINSTTSKIYYVFHNNGSSAVTFDVAAYDTLTAGTYSNTANTGAGEFHVALEANGTGVGACVGTAGGVAANSSCQFSVTFTPVTYGAVADARRYRWATLVSGGATGTQVGSVLGQVQKPATLSLKAVATSTVKVGTPTATDVDFGQILPQTSGTFTFTIVNTGETATTGPVALTLSSTSSYASVTATTCSATEALAGGASCTATVSVTGTVGLKNTVTARATSASGNSTEVWTLVVRVVNAASLSLTSDAASFATPTPASVTSSETRTITVLNGAAGDTVNTTQTSGLLSVALSNSTDFAIDKAASTCYETDSLGARVTKAVVAGSGGACTIVVTFGPEAAGSKTTTLSVGATPGGATQTVTLTATALGDLTITPAGTDAAPTAVSTTTGSTTTFTVANVTSSLTTGLLRSALAGTSAAAFVIVNDTCYGQMLDPGQSCTVGVMFVGTSSATTAQTANITVTDGKANDTVTAFFKVGGPT